MKIETQDISALVDSIWSSLLAMVVEPAPEETMLPQRDDLLTGCVQITGQWFGAVTLECPEIMAHLAAGILFGVPKDGTTDEQACDALGELTNITGGNLKALLPEPSFLSLPTVTRGQEYDHHVLRSKVQTRATFQCEGLPLRVTVFEGEPNRVPVSFPR
jgi:chemotaxis protein CheX